MILFFVFFFFIIFFRGVARKIESDVEHDSEERNDNKDSEPSQRFGNGAFAADGEKEGFIGQRLKNETKCDGERASRETREDAGVVEEGTLVVVMIVGC